MLATPKMMKVSRFELSRSPFENNKGPIGPFAIGCRKFQTPPEFRSLVKPPTSPPLLR